MTRHMRIAILASPWLAKRTREPKACEASSTVWDYNHVDPRIRGLRPLREDDSPGLVFLHGNPSSA